MKALKSGGESKSRSGEGKCKNPLRHFFLLTLFAGAWASPASAVSELEWQEMTTKEEAPLPADYHEVIAEAERYLNGLSTLRARFVQTADGQKSGGKFYLSRPGRLRWEYEPPVPVLIVVNHGVVSYYDYELNQLSTLSVDETLLNVLTEPDIRLEGAAIHTQDVRVEDGSFSLTLIQHDNPEAGALALRFTRQPVMLSQIAVTDAAGQTTVLNLEGIEEGVELGDPLFYLPTRKIIKER